MSNQETENVEKNITHLEIQEHSHHDALGLLCGFCFLSFAQTTKFVLLFLLIIFFSKSANKKNLFSLSPKYFLFIFKMIS